MKNNKTYIVVYADVRGMNYEQIVEYLREIPETLSRDYDPKEITHYILPTWSTSGTKVECINPVLLPEEEYKGVSEKVAKLEAELKSAIENYGKRQ